MPLHFFLHTNVDLILSIRNTFNFLPEEKMAFPYCFVWGASSTSSFFFVNWSFYLIYTGLILYSFPLDSWNKSNDVSVISAMYLNLRYAYIIESVQFSSVTQLCPTLCNPMGCNIPGFPVHHQLPELVQTQVHQVSDAIQPSHPLSSPFPPTFNLSHHQGLFQWVSSSHQAAKVLELQLQYQSFQWIFRTDFLYQLPW